MARFSAVWLAPPAIMARRVLTGICVKVAQAHRGKTTSKTTAA